MKLLGTKEIALLTRLFGPEVPPGMGFAPAKRVSWKCGDDARVPVQTLIDWILHKGIDGGFIAGWLVQRDGEWVRLDVLRSATPPQGVDG